MLPNSKKGFYHSELVAETQTGPVWITFTGEGKVTIDGQKDPFAPCRINDQPFHKDGQEVDRYYNIENAAIRAHLDTLTPGNWYQVRAMGSRDAAVLEIKDAQGAPIPAPGGHGGPPSPPPSAPPPNRTASGPGAPPAAAAPSPNGKHGEAVDVLMARCLKSAAFIVTMAAKRAGIQPSDDALIETIHANAATLFIQASRNGGVTFAYDTAELEQKPNAVDAMAKSAPAGVGAGPFTQGDDDLPF